MARPSGYGTVVESTTGNRTGTHESTGQEEQPLLGLPSPKPWWCKNMKDDVHRDWADVVLIICYAITGLLDSASISTWGSFVSMQTGVSTYLISEFSRYVVILHYRLTGLSRKYRLYRSWVSSAT